MSELAFAEHDSVEPVAAIQHAAEFYLDDPALLTPHEADFSNKEKAARNHARTDAFADIRRVHQANPAVGNALRYFELPLDERERIGSSRPLRDLRTLAEQYRRLDDDEVYPLFKSMETGLETYVRIESPVEDASESESLALTKVVAADSILFHTNLRLPLDRVRKKYGGMFEGKPFLEDVAMAGIDGLERAVQLFDYRMGYKFSTYAVKVIDQQIIRYVADNARTVRLPVDVDSKHKKISTTSARLTTELKREPSLSEIATATKMEELQVVELQELGRYNVTSLDSRVVDDSEFTLGDVTVDHRETSAGQRSAEQNELNELLGETLSDGTLTLNEKLIISLRFGIYDESIEHESYESLFDEAAGNNGEGLNYKRLGEALGGITVNAARDMESEALAKLAASDGLRAFADSSEDNNYYVKRSAIGEIGAYKLV